MPYHHFTRDERYIVSHMMLLSFMRTSVVARPGIIAGGITGGCLLRACGPERLRRDLAKHVIKVGIYRIRKKLGIWCKQIKQFKATTDLKH